MLKPYQNLLHTGQLPSNSSQEFRLDIFSGVRMSFVSPLHCKQTPQKQHFLSLKLEYWLSEYHRFHPYFVRNARNFSLFIFFLQAKSHSTNCKSLILFLLINTYTTEFHSNVCYALLSELLQSLPHFYTLAINKNL